MIVSLIVAIDHNRGIGLGGGLPWHLGSDLKRFKTLTMGHYLLMGRKTFESIGKPLAGRKMIIVTRNPAYKVEGCLVVGSLDQGLEMARRYGEEELFIIGGGEIFEMALPLAQRIYLTTVHVTTDADTVFPEIDFRDWKEIESAFCPAGQQDDFDHTFTLFARKSHPVQGSNTIS